MKKQTLSNKILSLFFVIFCLSTGTIALTACTGENHAGNENAGSQIAGIGKI